jgi:hypothetical protein
MDLCVILRVRLDHFDPSRRWRLGMQERKTMLPADAGLSPSVAGRCSAAGAEFLRRLRDQKLYLSRAVACEEFRPQYLLLGKTPASSITRNLEEFSSRPPGLTCISHRTLRVALWRRLFSLPRRLSSRRMDREPLPQHFSARVPRRQPKRLRHEQLAQCRLKGDEKSGLNGYHLCFGSMWRTHSVPALLGTLFLAAGPRSEGRCGTHVCAPRTSGSFHSPAQPAAFSRQSFRSRATHSVHPGAVPRHRSSHPREEPSRPRRGHRAHPREFLPVAAAVAELRQAAPALPAAAVPERMCAPSTIWPPISGASLSSALRTLNLRALERGMLS